MIKVGEGESGIEWLRTTLLISAVGNGRRRGSGFHCLRKMFIATSALRPGRVHRLLAHASSHNIFFDLFTALLSQGERLPSSGGPSSSALSWSVAQHFFCDLPFGRGRGLSRNDCSAWEYSQSAKSVIEYLLELKFLPGSVK